MANVKKPFQGGAGVFEAQYKPMYHKLLSMDNLEWERLREKASQKAGNMPSKYFDDIKEEIERNPGRRKVFDLISKVNAPRIAARMVERVPDIHNEEGGSLVDQLHQIMTYK